MQRARFAREFVAELLREPRAMRVALLSERERWLRGVRVGGKEDLLFELEMLLRAVERTVERSAATAEPVLGRDFAEELRALRDVVRRAATLARRLVSPSVEAGLRFRTYMERRLADRAQPRRVARDLLDQHNPEESLYLLAEGLAALQGLCDQLLHLPFVTWRAWCDLGTMASQTVLSNRYFRPPGALEFRAEYDRVGSVRLLDLVRRVDESRARKALALGFLACFRVLRYLRYVPAPPVALPRRALPVLLTAREEAAAVAGFLGTDLPRLSAAAGEAKAIARAGADAAARLRSALQEATASLGAVGAGRESIDTARDALSDGAKGAAAILARAVEPASTPAEVFDGQRARRDRAEKLRRDLRVLLQLLRDALDDLFPAMKGESPASYAGVGALERFVQEFRRSGYHLLRAGDLEPFDRFFQALDACAEMQVAATRDRQLYLDCRRFLVVVERGLALVTRRAEILGVPFDVATYESELARFRRADLAAPPPVDDGVADHLLAPPGEDDEDAEPLEPEVAGGLPEPELPPVEPLPRGEQMPWVTEEPTQPHRVSPLPPDGPDTVEFPAVPPPPAPDLLAPDDPAAVPPVPDPEPLEPFDPDMTRRLWR